MNTAYALSPLFRHTVGFDRFNQLFDTLSKVEDNAASYPPYNIEKTGEDTYAITMAIAGFGEKDLTITQEGDALSVRGKIEKEASEQERHYLYKGIATRSFERKFSLADHVKVGSARVENGLLVIDLKREVPEEAKPRQIKIVSAKGSKLIDSQ
jgi:molecular chaperone IbpA